MKIFIAVDLEGAAGFIRSTERSEDRAIGRELMTAEANAGIAGACEGGAKEILVNDAHGNYVNFLPDKIDRRAKFLSGTPKPFDHMAGIDDTFDAMLYLGAHAKAGTLKGLLDHSFGSGIYCLKFNGIEMGEIGTGAAIAGHFGVPLVMIAGDQAACEEARELLGDIETVSVKEGVTREAAICLPTPVAYDLIREAAQRAMAKIKTAKPFVIAPPVRVEMTFTHPGMADAVTDMPFVERLDGRTIAFTGEDFAGASELCKAIRFLASATGGR